MSRFDDLETVSRRAVLKASGGAISLRGVGTVQATTDDSANESEGCPETTVRPETIPYDDSLETVCADDHPATQELQSAVKTTLSERFLTVGSLIDAGYIPYFDFLAADGDDGWSHWLNPEFIGDDSVMDPDRPESILVDDKWWRPIGVMFIATRDGERVDPPPAVYEDEEKACTPWHAHVGLPGRYSWWKYKQLYLDESDVLLYDLPCRTPWVMHTWAYPHPESVYAHGAPPRGNRGGPPAEKAGFETDAVPGEDDLGPSVLPDALRHRLKHL